MARHHGSKAKGALKSFSKYLISGVAIVAMALAASVVLSSCSPASNGGSSASGAQQNKYASGASVAANSKQAASKPSQHAIHHEQDDRAKATPSANDVPPEPEVVYLTFDDGPSGQTSKILDTLDKYGIKATWFVTGVAPNFDAVKEVWDRGHQIGLHSTNHDYKTVYASPQAFVNDYSAIQSRIEEKAGVKPTLLRFIGGSKTTYTNGKLSEIQNAIANQGWHYFDWNVSIGDSTNGMSSIEHLMGNITNNSENKHSICLLMHDSDSKSSTADALDQVIQYYISKGFKFDYLTADSYGYHH